MKPADVRAAVLQRLAMLDQLAVHGPTESQLPLARTELRRLADGWRTLLAVHQPGSDGRCRACPARLRRRRWPCRLWKTAYQHLIGDGESLTTRHRRGRNQQGHRRHGR